MPAHSQPLATVMVILEDERARLRQVWADYQESYMDDIRNQVYVQSVYDQLHGHRGRFGGQQAHDGPLTPEYRTPRCVFP